MLTISQTIITMEMTLYQISQEQKRINAMLEESGGEITPEIDELMTINNENFTQKAQDYGYAILHYEAFLAAIKAEIARLEGYADTCTKSIKNMKGRVKDYMVENGIAKVEREYIALSLRKSTRVIIDDENAVPADCKTIKVDINKADLKRHIKAGEECGAHLEENHSLIIK